MPLFAGMNRSLGEMSEPFHMNDIEKEGKRESEGRKERRILLPPAQPQPQIQSQALVQMDELGFQTGFRMASGPSRE